MAKIFHLQFGGYSVPFVIFHQSNGKQKRLIRLKITRYSIRWRDDVRHLKQSIHDGSSLTLHFAQSELSQTVGHHDTPSRRDTSTKNVVVVHSRANALEQSKNMTNLQFKITIENTQSAIGQVAFSQNSIAIEFLKDISNEAVAYLAYDERLRVGLQAVDGTNQGFN